MTTLSIVINVSNPDANDSRAMRFMIEAENSRRERLSPPLSPLPLSTAAERRASYETVLSGIVMAAHVSYISQANAAVESDVQFKDLRPFWADASPAKKSAALAALQSNHDPR